jgi:hypothetical protein
MAITGDLVGVSQLGNEYRLHVLNHLGCDSGRQPSSFDSLSLCSLHKRSPSI